MSQTNPADNVKPVINVSLWLLVVSLAFLNVFITFRGVSSAAAMDQAQVARELARGNGFSTQFIRPVAVQQLQGAGKTVTMTRLPDTANPPLQPLIWAPVFKALQKMWSFDRKSTVYVLDRVIGCIGVCWMMLTLLLAHGMARRMFDRTLANFAVLALALSKPLWDVAVATGSRGLLMFLTTLCLYWLMLLMRRADSGAPSGLLPILIGLTCAAMMLTHWMAVWLVLGVIIAVAVLLSDRRGALFIIALLPMLAVTGWCARNVMVSGEVLGTTKVTLQSILTPQPESLLVRDYQNMTPPVNLTAMGRDLNANLITQMQGFWDHMMGVVPAVLFFLALLHRFRRPDVASFRWALGIVLLSVIIGTAMIGLPGKSLDDNQVHAALVPALAVFGLAGFAVLWARFGPGRGGAWTMHGYAILAIVIGGWPTLVNLTSDLRLGLFFKDQLMQWPPYRPDMTSVLNALVKPDELVVSDAPWAVSWYADRSALWLPKTREQFRKLRDLSQSQNHHVAGFVMSPVSTQDSTFSTQFTGAFADWIELVARGPMFALGPDIAALPSGAWMRDYSKAWPMSAALLPDGRRVPLLCFFADYERWAPQRAR